MITKSGWAFSLPALTLPLACVRVVLAERSISSRLQCRCTTPPEVEVLLLEARRRPSPRIVRPRLSPVPILTPTQRMKPLRSKSPPRPAPEPSQHADPLSIPPLWRRRTQLQQLHASASFLNLPECVTCYYSLAAVRHLNLSLPKSVEPPQLLQAPSKSSRTAMPLGLSRKTAKRQQLAAALHLFQMIDPTMHYLCPWLQVKRRAAAGHTKLQ